MNSNNNIIILDSDNFESIDDFPDKEQSFAEWRKNWIDNGCIWFSGNTEPQNWDANEQLKIFNKESM